MWGFCWGFVWLYGIDLVLDGQLSGFSGWSGEVVRTTEPKKGFDPRTKSSSTAVQPFAKTDSLSFQTPYLSGMLCLPLFAVAHQCLLSDMT